MRPAVVTLLLTLALCPLAISVTRRRGLLDHPNSRSSHDVPTPRSGGIAPALGGLTGLTIAGGLSQETRLAVVAAGAAFGALGLADDLLDIPALRRLAWQFAIAVALLVPLLDGVSGPVAWRVVFGTGVVLWLVAYINAFNFMDGINGVAATQAGLAGGYWAAIGAGTDTPQLEVGGLIVCAAALGFAPFNVPNARVFLGDIGSYFFGGTIAALVVVGLRAGLPPEAVIAPVLLYLADTGFTIARRIRAGQVWHQAHREHVYQRLVHDGWSHARTTAFVGTVITIVSLLGAVSLASSTGTRIAADAVILAVLALYVSSPSLMSRLATEAP